MPGTGKSAGFTLAGTKCITRGATAVLNAPANIHPIDAHICVATGTGLTGRAFHLQIQNNPHRLVNEVRAVLGLPLIINVVVNTDIRVAHLAHPHTIGVPVTGAGNGGGFILPTPGIGVLPVSIAALEFHNVAFGWPAVGAGEPKCRPGAARRRCLNSCFEFVVGIVVVDQYFVFRVNRAGMVAYRQMWIGRTVALIPVNS